MELNALVEAVNGLLEQTAEGAVGVGVVERLEMVVVHDRGVRNEIVYLCVLCQGGPRMWVPSASDVAKLTSDRSDRSGSFVVPIKCQIQNDADHNRAPDRNQDPRIQRQSSRISLVVIWKGVLCLFGDLCCHFF